MAKYLPTLRTELVDLIKDKDEYLTSDDRNNALERSVRLLSRRSPVVKYKEQTGDGSSYQWAIVDDYFVGFSSIVKVEYPFSATTQTPNDPLEPYEWEVIEYSSGSYYFRLKSAIPTASETLRYTYTTFHTVTEAASTIISAEDEDRVTYYAAALCLKRMAARAISVRNPTINADTVDYQSRSREYTELAKMYEDMSGLASYANSDQIGALVYSDYDPPDPEGYQQLTHFRQWR